MHAPPPTLFTFYLTIMRMSYRTIDFPSPFVAWSSTFKCSYKTTSIKYVFIVCDTILAAVHSSSWIRFDYYQSPLLQGQTDTSASQGTRVYDDNQSANSIHIHWSFEPCSQYSYVQSAEGDPDFLKQSFSQTFVHY